METLLAAGAMLASGWGLRRLAHHVIVRGLRAPRVPHGQQAARGSVPPGHVRELRIAGPRGRTLFGCLVMPQHTDGLPLPAVLVMHGWGGNAAMMWPVVRPLHDAGFAVLLIDARCHGRSDDDTFASMPRFAEDIAAGLAWLRLQPGIDADRLCLLGHSVGAAAAMLHASRHDDVRAVASLAAFAHPREVMLRLMAEHRVPYVPFGWYVLRHVQRVIGASFDAIAPLATLARLNCQTLLIHGRHDETVPVGDARRLSKASGRATLLLVDGGHDLRLALDGHAAALVNFLHGACRELAPSMPHGERGRAA